MLALAALAISVPVSVLLELPGAASFAVLSLGSPLRRCSSPSPRRGYAGVRGISADIDRAVALSVVALTYHEVLPAAATSLGGYVLIAPAVTLIVLSTDLASEWGTNSAKLTHLLAGDPCYKEKAALAAAGEGYCYGEPTLAWASCRLRGCGGERLWSVPRREL